MDHIILIDIALVAIAFLVWLIVIYLINPEGIDWPAIKRFFY